MTASRRSTSDEFSGSTEQLEPRLALAVDLQILEPDAANNFPGRIYATVDQGSDAYFQIAPVTHDTTGDLTRDLLVADNGSFLDAQVVNEVDQSARYDSLTVFSGTKREDIGVVAKEWWLLDPDGIDSRQITGLQLYDGDDLYAHSLLDGFEWTRDQIAGSSDIQQPNNALNEIYGSISYTQYDGTVSRWYFTNYDFTTQVFEIEKAFITAGPGVPTDGGAPNRTSLNDPLFRFQEELVEGYNYPVSLELRPERGSGDTRYNKTLYINWSQTPTAPPIVTATFPKTRPIDPPGAAPDSLDYTNIRRGTVTGTLSRGDLEFILPGAHATGSDGTPPSLGIVTGTLAGEIFAQTAFNRDSYDEQFAQLGISELVSRTDRSGATRDGVTEIRTINFAGEQGPADEPRTIDQVDTVAAGTDYDSYTRIASRRISWNTGAGDNWQTVNPLSEIGNKNTNITGFNSRFVSDVEVTFEVNQRTISAGIRTVAAAGVRSFRSEGANIASGSSPTINATYLTFTRDQPATVTFAAGANINQEVIVELTAPGSSVFVNSPITTTRSGGDIDLRATNVAINAPVTVSDRFDLGRSSSLASQPRLTLDTPGGNDDGFFDTPTLAPDRWTVAGREAGPVPVLGPGGRVQSLIVPAGAEGYGYDPNSPPSVEIAPPTPQSAEIDVLTVSGALSDNILIGSRGVAIPDGVTEVRIPADSDDYQFTYVRKISSGGTYDFTNAAGELNTAAIPIVVVAEPDLLRNETRVGYGRAATAVAEWSTGIDYVQVTNGGSYVQNQNDQGWDPGANFNPSLTISAPTQGSIRFRPTVPISNNKINERLTNEGKIKTSSIATGLYPTAIVGAGYDKDNPPSVTAKYGIEAFVPPDAFRENILSLRVTDGGENYEGAPPVIDLVTKFDASGVAARTGYVPNLDNLVAENSVFIGPEIGIGFVTSSTSTYQDRNLFEYLQIGMPIVGSGIRSGATIQGIDFTAGVLSLSPNGIESPALLGAASIYPHEWYVDPANQPDPDKIKNLVLIPTLTTDDAILRIEGQDGEILSATWADPETATPYVVTNGTATVQAAWDPFSGEFAGRTRGLGYTAVPVDGVATVLDVALTTRSLATGGSGFVEPPALNFELAGKLAELQVVVAGSNYLTDQPNRTGTVSLSVFGPAEGSQGLASFDVVNGRFSGGGSIPNPGSGYLGSVGEQAQVEQVDPDEFAEGFGLRAVFEAVVDARGVVKEFVRVSGGSEYVTTPGTFVEAPPALQAATAAAQVDRISGTVTSVSLVTSGTGYRVPPAVIIDPPGPEGVGRRARAVAIIEGGSVVRVEIVDSGQGYTAEPIVRLSDPDAAAVVENFLVNADVAAGIYEMYVANEPTTIDQGRGLLRVAPEVNLSNGGTAESQAFYLEAYGADLFVDGTIRAAEQQFLLQSPVLGAYEGPFTAELNAQGNTLAMILGNESEPGISDAYRHSVTLATEVDQLRIAASDIGYGERTPFPYDLTVANQNKLTVDSVLSAGGDVDITVEDGELVIESSLETAAGLSIKANTFKASSPLRSLAGPISIEATGNEDQKVAGDLNILNSVEVTRTSLDATREDIVLRAGTKYPGTITLAGDLRAVNTVRIDATVPVIDPVVDNSVGVLVSAGTDATISADRLVVTTTGDVKVNTDVRSVLVQADVDRQVVIEEKNDVLIDIAAGEVSVTALGTDGAGANLIALSGVLRDVETSVLSAPNGSIDVRNDASGQLVLGRSDQGSVAAGDVAFSTDAIAVSVVDAAVAGGNARTVRVATTAAFRSDVLYSPGITGLVSATLEGDGSIVDSAALLQSESGFDLGDLRVGDRVLVKNEFGAEFGRRNGVYEIVRLGGGAGGFSRWLLERAADSATQEGMPTGSFIRVTEGDSSQAVYQVEYVPRVQRLVEVNREGQVIIPETLGESALDGVEVGTIVTGDALVAGVTVQSIDWANRVISLGVIDGQVVRYLSEEEVDARIASKRVEKPNEGEDYVGFQLLDANGQDVTSDADPLIQAIRENRRDNMTVRVTAVGLNADASIVAAQNGTLLVPAKYAEGDDGFKNIEWTEAELSTQSQASTIRVGFAKISNNGRTLNPAARAQLLTASIERVSGDTIVLSSDFYRWDAIKVGQSLFGAGFTNVATVQSFDIPTRTVTVSPGSVAASLPKVLEIGTVASGVNESPDSFDRIYLDPLQVSEAEFIQIQYGDIVRAGGLEPFSTVVGTDVRENAIFLAPGSINAFGAPGAVSVSGLQVLDGETLTTRLEGKVFAVSGVAAAATAATAGDFVRLQSVEDDSTGSIEVFDDRSFEHLWVGMEVRGTNIRPAAKVTYIDPIGRVIGLTSGAIRGPVTQIEFLAPAYGIEDFDGSAGTLRGTQKNLLDEGKLPSVVRASVADWSSVPVGRLDGELYRVWDDAATVGINQLPEESRTRFIKTAETAAPESWTENVFVGQKVVTDLVEFSTATMWTAPNVTEEVLATAMLPANSVGAGSRVYTLVEANESTENGVPQVKTRLVRWDHVASGDESQPMERKGETEVFVNKNHAGPGIVERVTVNGQHEYLAVARGEYLEIYENISNQSDPVEVKQIFFNGTTNGEVKDLYYDLATSRLIVATSAEVTEYEVQPDGQLVYKTKNLGPAYGVEPHRDASGNLTGKIWIVRQSEVHLFAGTNLSNGPQATAALQAGGSFRGDAAAVSSSNGQVYVLSLDAGGERSAVEVFNEDASAPQVGVFHFPGLGRDLVVDSDGINVYVAAGSAGLMALTQGSQQIQNNVTYNLSKDIIEFGDSIGVAGGGYEPVLIGAGGSLTFWRKAGLFDESLPRSVVQGVDYATGVVSITGEGYGLGEDRKIVTVGGFDYAIAPSAKVHFSTEAVGVSKLPRLNDTQNSLDNGTVVELTEGYFSDGYVIADQIFGYSQENFGESGIEAWKSLEGMFTQGGDGPQFFIQNKFGDWIQGGSLTGLDSFNNVVGLKSDTEGLSVQRLLREVSDGTDQMRVLVDPTPVVVQRSSNARVLDKAELNGDEIEILIGGQRPYDTASQFGGMFVADEAGPWVPGNTGSELTQYPVTLDSQFVAYSTIRPGMQVSGEGFAGGNAVVTAVDAQNRIVWVSKSRELAGLVSYPQNNGLQFTHTLDRAGDYNASALVGAIGESSSALPSSFDGGLITVEAGDLGGISKLRVGMAVEPLVPVSHPMTGNGGFITGFDYKTGVIGVSYGTILSGGAGLIRFSSDTAGEIDRWDLNDNGWIDDDERLRDPALQDLVAAQVSSARGSAAGVVAGTVVRLRHAELGIFTDWAALPIGGGVYLETPIDDGGGEKQLLFAGVLSGYDPMLGSVSIDMTGVDGIGSAAFLETARAAASARLVFINTPENDQQAPGFDPADPLYVENDIVVAVGRIADVERNYSEDPGVTRLAVSQASDRSQYSGSSLFLSGDEQILVSEYGVIRDDFGQPITASPITLGESAGIAGKQGLHSGDLVDGGEGFTVAGSSVQTLRVTSQGWRVETNGGVVTPDGGWVNVVGDVFHPAAQNAVAWTTDTAIDRLSTQYVGSYEGDLLKVDAGAVWQTVVKAFNDGKTVTVAPGVAGPDRIIGAGLRDPQSSAARAPVIGLDPVNNIVILEAGSVVHTSLVDLRFYVNGKRIAASGPALESLGAADQGYFSDATVLNAVRLENAGDFTPVGSGQATGVLLLRLATNTSFGGQLGEQPRFSRYSEIDINSNVTIFDPSVGLNVNLGVVQGVDATNSLVSIEVSDFDDAIRKLGLTSVVQFASVGSTPNDLAVVETFGTSSSAQGSFGGVSDRVSRLTVDPLFENWAALALGDLVSGLGVAPHKTEPNGSLSGPKIVGIDPATRTLALEYVNSQPSSSRSALLNEKQVTSIQVFSSSLPDPLTQPFLSLNVQSAVGYVDGAFTNGSTSTYAVLTMEDVPNELQIGDRVEADPLRGALGKFGEVLGWSDVLGVIAVSSGIVTNSAPGAIEFYSGRAPVQAWSEPQGTSASGWNGEGHTFDQTRISVSPNSFSVTDPTQALERVRLGTPIYHSAGAGSGLSTVGHVTGVDRDLSLLGATDLSSQVLPGELLRMPIAELVELTSVGQMQRSEVQGVFEGARFLFWSHELTTPSGVPVSHDDLEIGMPLWDEDYNILANITGIATFEGVAGLGDSPVVFLGLTANTSNGLSNADIAAGGVADIGKNEVVYFGGYRSAGQPVDVVAKLSRLNYSADVTDSTSLVYNPQRDANGNPIFPAPVTGVNGVDENYLGFNVGRIELVGWPAIPNDSLMGASVSGPGIAPGTIVTAYDQGLELIGLSTASSVVPGTVITITPNDVVSPTPVTEVVANSSVTAVGDLNGSLGTSSNNWNNEHSVLRIELDPGAIIPADLNQWLGAEISEAAGATLGGDSINIKVVISGIDPDLRLLALRTVRVDGGNLIPYEPVVTTMSSPVGLTSVTPSAWLSLGHSNARREGSGFDLVADTPVFVAPSSLAVERLDGPAREVAVTGTGTNVLELNVQAADDLSWLRLGMLVAGGNPIQRIQIPAGAYVQEINQTADPNTGTVTTTVTLAHADPSISIGVSGLAADVLFMTMVTDEVVVGDSLLVRVGSSGSEQTEVYRISGIDPVLGLLTVDDEPGQSDSRSLDWLLSQGQNHRFEVIASADVIASSGGLPPGVNGFAHTFDEARIVVDELNDAASPTDASFNWSDLYIGQNVSGNGINSSSRVIVTGVDQQLGLIGLGVEAGGISGISGRFTDQVVVDGASLSELVFEQNLGNATAAAVSPDWNPLGALSPNHVLLRLADGYEGFGWLGEILDQGGSLQITAEAKDYVNPGRPNDVVFGIQHTSVNPVIVGIDTQLSLVQLDLSSVSGMTGHISKISELLLQKIDGDGQPIYAADASNRVVIQSMSVDITDTLRDPNDVHGQDAEELILDLTFNEFNNLLATDPRFIRGTGIGSKSPITRMAFSNGQAKLIVPAGTVTSREELFSNDGQIVIDHDEVAGNGNERYVQATGVVSSIVGTVLEDRVSLSSNFQDYTQIAIGDSVVGLPVESVPSEVLAAGAIVTGYDAANRVLGITSGSVKSSSDGSIAVRVGGNSELLTAKTVAVGELRGDRITLSERVDLSAVAVGDRIRGDGLALSSRIVGIVPERNQLVLSVGAVQQADRIQQVFIGSSPNPTAVNTQETVISSGTTNGVVLRITDAFTQYNRLFVGMSVAGLDGVGTGGLSTVARIVGLDEANRLLFLADSAVNDLSVLDQLVFRDTDGQFSADIERDEFDRPRASYGVNSPESSIRGTLDGDLVVVANATSRTFDDIGLGLPVEIDGVAREARVIGFEPRTGVVALPYGSLETSSAIRNGKALAIPVRSGFDAELIQLESSNQQEGVSDQAAVTFQQKDVATLASVVVGQQVIGDGIRGIAVVKEVDLSSRTVRIVSRDGGEILLNSELVSPPTNIQFTAPTDMVLGAVTRSGTETVQFEVSEFGVAQITVRNPRQENLAGLKPSGGTANNSSSSIELASVEQVNSLELNQQVTGTVFREGFRYLRPRLESKADGLVAEAQFYSGVLAPKKLSNVWMPYGEDGSDEITFVAIYGNGFNGLDVEEISPVDPWPGADALEPNKKYQIPVRDPALSNDYWAEQVNAYSQHLKTWLDSDTLAVEVIRGDVDANGVERVTYRETKSPSQNPPNAFGLMNADRLYIRDFTWVGPPPSSSELAFIGSADGLGIREGDRGIGIFHDESESKVIVGLPAGAIERFDVADSVQQVLTFEDESGDRYQALGVIDQVARTPEVWQDGVLGTAKQKQDAREGLGGAVLELKLIDPYADSLTNFDEFPDYQTLSPNTQAGDADRVVTVNRPEHSSVDWRLKAVSPVSQAIWMNIPEDLFHDYEDIGKDTSLGKYVEDWTVAVGGVFTSAFLTQPGGVANATLARTEARADTKIGTENPLGNTTFKVSKDGESYNDDPGSLGKMIRVWQSAQKSKSIADANPEFRFQFDDTVNNIALRQELPVITAPMFIDGLSQVAIDGALIDLDVNGQSLEGAANGFRFKGIDVYGEPPASALPGSKPLVGVRGVTLSGFTGAAVVLDDTKGVLVDNIVTGVDQNLQQSANRYGVWVTGDSQWNAIKGSRILTSDVGVRIDGEARNNIIVSSSIGDSLSNNNVGIQSVSGPNWLGARADLSSGITGASGNLHSIDGEVDKRTFIPLGDLSAEFAKVRPGMGISFQEYPKLRLRVTGVEPESNAIYVSTEAGIQDEYDGGNETVTESVMEEAVSRTVQRLTATVAYPASGEFNSGVLTLTDEIWDLVQGGVYVGQSITGNGIPNGTVITHVDELGDAPTSRVRLTLSNKLVDSGYRGPEQDNRLISFGLEAESTTLLNNQVAVQLGLGAAKVNGIAGSKIVYFPDGFETLDSVKPGMKAVFSDPGSFENSGNEYFIESVDLVQRAVVLTEPLRLETGRIQLHEPNDQSFRSVAFVSGGGTQGQGIVARNLEIIDSFGNGIEIYDGAETQIGSSAAYRPVVTSYAVGAKAFTSWGISASVNRGQTKVAVNDTGAVTLKLFAIDLSNEEREGFDEKFTFDQYSDLLKGQKVYGRGIPEGTEVSDYRREDGQLTLSLSKPVEISGTTELSFGIGWWQELELADVRIGDRVVTETTGGVFTPGRDIPQFTEVVGVGTNYVRLSTPLAGLRLETVAGRTGTEGFRGKGGAGTNPEPVAFVPVNGVRNVVAGNQGLGIWTTAAALEVMSSNSANGNISIVGNQFNTIRDGSGDFVYKPNELGAILPDLFWQLAGEHLTKNDWDKSDRFANLYDLPDYAFEVFLDGEVDDASDRRPGYWYT